MTETATEIGPVTISDACARRIRELRAAENDGTLMLRVAVGGGGCSGFQYSFTLDDTVNADDAVFERDGVKLVVDDVSLPFLAGAEVHYVEELVGSYFTVKNPNATSTCGCGTSFAVG
jgi:iron-sulfur cluster insertion protein